MAGRILHSRCGLHALIAGLALRLAEPSTASELIRQALALAGERWYALTLEESVISVTSAPTTTGTAKGNWVFESEQRFAMNPYDHCRHYQPEDLRQRAAAPSADQRRTAAVPARSHRWRA